MTRIEKSFEELNLSKVNFKNDRWYWESGRSSLKSNQWSIVYSRDFFTEVKYKLPDCINEMLEARYKKGFADANARYIMDGSLGF